MRISESPSPCLDVCVLPLGPLAEGDTVRPPLPSVFLALGAPAPHRQPCSGLFRWLAGLVFGVLTPLRPPSLKGFALSLDRLLCPPSLCFPTHFRRILK
jgi:hypothetical protein